MYEYGMNGYSMGFGWLMPILFLGVIIYFISSNKTSSDKETARDILDKRYANGEINDEEYKVKKASLK